MKGGVGRLFDPGLWLSSFELSALVIINVCLNISSHVSKHSLDLSIELVVLHNHFVKGVTNLLLLLGCGRFVMLIMEFG